jgi:hypothetical protein
MAHIRQKPIVIIEHLLDMFGHAIESDAGHACRQITFGYLVHAFLEPAQRPELGQLNDVDDAQQEQQAADQGP